MLAATITIFLYCSTVQAQQWSAVQHFYGRCLLMEAKKGHVDVLGRILKQDCPINYQGPPFYAGALHLAALYDHSDCISLLCCQGADKEARDGWGCTPLHRACDKKNLSAIKTLLKAGANPHALSQQKMEHTPPFLLTQRTSYTEDELGVCIVELLKYGADLLILNGDNYTPLHLFTCSLLMNIMNDIAYYHHTVFNERVQKHAQLSKELLYLHALNMGYMSK